MCNTSLCFGNVFELSLRVWGHQQNVFELISVRMCASWASNEKWWSSAKLVWIYTMELHHVINCNQLHFKKGNILLHLNIVNKQLTVPKRFWIDGDILVHTPLFQNALNIVNKQLTVSKRFWIVGEIGAYSTMITWT